MTFAQCIEWLNGTARNMNDIADANPDGYADGIESCEMKEMAEMMCDVAKALVAHEAARARTLARQMEDTIIAWLRAQAGISSSERAVALRDAASVLEKLRLSNVAQNVAPAHAPGDGRQS